MKLYFAVYSSAGPESIDESDIKYWGDAVEELDLVEKAFTDLDADAYLADTYDSILLHKELESYWKKAKPILQAGGRFHYGADYVFVGVSSVSIEDAKEASLDEIEEWQ